MIWICGFLFLLGNPYGSPGNLSDSPSFAFLAYGNLLTVNPQKQSLSYLYSFHPAAPTVERAPDGLYWARRGEHLLTAFNPETQTIEAEVRLPHRPYNHIITPQGKAYVTHHTVTPRGFWISVVDTSQKKFIKAIKDIWGLRTGLAYGTGFVYLATIGTGRPDNLYLYRINTQNNRCQEIRRVPKAGFSWKISVWNGLLYLTHINLPGHSLSPMIEIMDPGKKKIKETFRSSDLSGIEKIQGKIFFFGDKGFLSCQTEKDEYGLALLDPRSGKIQDVLETSTPVYRVIGLKEDLLFYTDHPVQAGKKGISLYFYNLSKRKEVKTVNIKEFLKENKIF